MKNSNVRCEVVDQLVGREAGKEIYKLVVVGPPDEIQGLKVAIAELLIALRGDKEVPPSGTPNA